MGVNAERFSLDANPDRRLPVPLSQPLHFVWDVPQRAEDQTPGKLRGRMRGGLTGCGDHHSVLSAGVDVNVSCAAPGLADELELGQTLDQRARKRRACLGQYD